MSDPIMNRIDCEPDEPPRDELTEARVRAALERAEANIAAVADADYSDEEHAEHARSANEEWADDERVVVALARAWLDSAAAPPADLAVLRTIVGSVINDVQKINSMTGTMTATLMDLNAGLRRATTEPPTEAGR